MHRDMCVMLIEIQTIEGGHKRCLLTRGDQTFKKNREIAFGLGLSIRHGRENKRVLFFYKGKKEKRKSSLSNLVHNSPLIVMRIRCTLFVTAIQIMLQVTLTVCRMFAPCFQNSKSSLINQILPTHSSNHKALCIYLSLF